MLPLFYVALGLCAQPKVVYRSGTAIDQPAIAAAVLRESMNPLFLQPEQFIVASDAVDQQRVLGFGQLRPLSGAWELASLVVEPEARGRGLGSELVRRLLARVEGEAVWLLTLESTRRFYEPLGFAEAPVGAAPLMMRLEQFVGSMVAGVVAGQQCIVMNNRAGSSSGPVP
mmetsp:Transcript_1274/g.2523  ORF Transcript_1274/g.2523 Transcript_1274/m.2523 type:complete len:171 (+) Transcript_1274:78-590(+)|eukprot:CAMPEP_0119066320 /NCGR_PEP_ID=MMETSP1178-20130426/8911_1 /TAXON_ID=33656 /ORGANISM="unid sp, Strain CCMP2000" /LENGTH=170 /DNA_ID=CAMNT_0007047913 /DNA_START=78 /DNA_END=590 /DNA_ORIENTATION=+